MKDKNKKVCDAAAQSEVADMNALLAIWMAKNKAKLKKSLNDFILTGTYSFKTDNNGK